MVTLQTADNALKSFYLDAVVEEIDNKISPFLAKIEKTSAYVTGKDVAKVVKTGAHGGVGAGSEDGTLPKARPNEYVTFKAPLKNFYGTIEITDKAIRASANNDGAFVNLLNDEMKSLIKSAKSNFSRMLFGDGSGRVCAFVTSEGTNVTVDTVVGLEVGTYLDFYKRRTGELMEKERKILSIDRTENVIVFDEIEGDKFSLADTYAVISGTEPNSELSGLGAVFFGESIYGVQKDTEFMTPYVGIETEEITLSVIQKAIDSVEERSGGKINLMICNRGVRRALMDCLRENQVPYTMENIGDGQTAIVFNGIPVIVDDFSPYGYLYLLNTDDFKLCQLCDWQWMEGEDGKILKQIAGKPVYTATLVKYAELLCERPCGQGLIIDIAEH